MVKLYLAGFAALNLLVLPTFALPISPASSATPAITVNADIVNEYHKTLIAGIETRRERLLNNYWGAGSAKADFVRQVNDATTKDLKRVQAAADLEEDITRDMSDAEYASAGYLGHASASFKRRLSRRAIDYSAKVLESSPCAAVKEPKFRYYDDFLSEIRTKFQEGGHAFEASEYARLNFRDIKMYMHHWDVILGERMKLERELTAAATAWDYKVLLEKIEHQTEEGSQSNKQKYERYVDHARSKRSIDYSAKIPNDLPSAEFKAKYHDQFRDDINAKMGADVFSFAASEYANLPYLDTTMAQHHKLVVTEVVEKMQRELEEACDGEDYNELLDYYKDEFEYAARSNKDKFERYTKDLALETANPPPEEPGNSFHVLAARNDSSPTDTDRDRKYDEAMRAQGLVEWKTED